MLKICFFLNIININNKNNLKMNQKQNFYYRQSTFRHVKPILRVITLKLEYLIFIGLYNVF